jgi:hypothetical protein
MKSTETFPFMLTSYSVLEEELNPIGALLNWSLVCKLLQRKLSHE